MKKLKIKIYYHYNLFQLQIFLMKKVIFTIFIYYCIGEGLILISTN